LAATPSCPIPAIRPQEIVEMHTIADAIREGTWIDIRYECEEV
jgi:hypothetical protein